MQKNVQNCTPDSKAYFSVKIGSLESAKFPSQNEVGKNVKMGKIGRIEN
jgi:hypothetical protein